MKMKKIMAVICAMSLLTTAVTACSSEKKEESSSESSKSSSESESSADVSEDGREKEGNIYVEGYPVSDEVITYKIMNNRSDLDKSSSQNEKEMVKKAEEETNIHIEWTETNATAFNEQFSLLLTSGSGLPDAFLAQVTDSQITSNTSRFYEFTEDVLAKFAPNIYTQSEENIETGIEVFKKADGKIYSIPTKIWSSKTNEPNSIVFLNKGWMDNLAIEEMPSNIDELQAILEAFKDGDPNGNGTKDEIPFVFAQNNWAAKIQMLAGSWGITGRNLNNDQWFGVVKDGKYELNIDTQAFRDFLTEMNEWYNKGLINVDGFSMLNPEYNALLANNVHGMYGSWSPNIGEYEEGKWVGLNVMPAVGYEGQEVKSGEEGVINAALNGFMISNTCKEPMGVLRWWDYFHKDATTKRVACYGTQDLTWIENADGTAYAIDPDPLPSGFGSVSDLHNTYGWRATTGPLIFGDEEALPDPSAVTADSIRVDLGTYYVDYYLDEFIPTSSAPAKAADAFSFTKSEIETYVNSYMASAISNGVTDENWNEYLKNLKGYGIEEWVEYYQNYVDGTL